jgi:hypothetical protein
MVFLFLLFIAIAGAADTFDPFLEIPSNYSLQFGIPDESLTYSINLTLLFNFSGDSPRIGDPMIIALQTCWNEEYKSVLKDFTPRIQLIGNASSTFSDGFNMFNRDFHYVENSGSQFQLHLLYVPILVIPKVWEIQLVGHLTSDFLFGIPNPVRPCSFCKVDVALDRNEIWQKPNVSFPSILRGFEASYEQTSQSYAIKFNLDRDLHENDEILIWMILVPSIKIFNVSFQFTSIEPSSLKGNISDFGNCAWNGTVSNLLSEKNVLRAYISNFQEVHQSLLQMKNDNLIWNAKIYLISSVMPKFAGTSNSFKLWIALGISACLIFLFFVSFLLMKRYCKQDYPSENKRYSHSSTVFADDDSYTLHSESTISSVGTFLSKT